MLVFAASDKGGTGRSVTSCNIAYRLSMTGRDVAYLDFDFGSPTAGAIFEIAKIDRGTPTTGLHECIAEGATDPDQFDVRSHSDRQELRALQAGAGRLVLFPGDLGGAEFGSTPEGIARCVDLFQRLDNEFDICVVDLSAGRSHAVGMSLAAMATPELRTVPVRWVVFHRWTRQHIVAAANLVTGEHGLLKMGADVSHDPERLANAIKFVRTAVPELRSPTAAARPTQARWLQRADRELNELARRYNVGQDLLLGSTPVEPVLQWREQLIIDSDVTDNIANGETVAAFNQLVKDLLDDGEWEGQ
ncbi:SCO2523 family variant P-loop protein [Pseudofrankia sp. DC12]|uniref:SCO2523 family variant P-loop protein n=1 Tax=Pseudofrankia sp. DC12 TaxID=683315 RepID=UPI0005F84ED6|nr:SCO2523 family variant P-loop protein [Pseudofrankia sp. DC12]